MDSDSSTLDLRRALREREWVYRLVYRLVRDPHLAEDITQNTFVRLLQHQRDYDGTRLQGLLGRIARNLVWNHQRDQAVRRRREETWKHTLAHHESPEVGEALQRAEVRAILADALRSLTPELRKAVVLRDLEDWDYGRMAAHLAVSAGVCRKRVHRARKKLRGLLHKRLGADWRGLLAAPFGVQLPAPLPALAPAAAALLVLVLGAAAFLLLRPEPAPDAELQAAQPAAGEAASADTPVVYLPPRPPRPEAAGTASRGSGSSAATGGLALQIQAEDGSPMAGVPVYAWTGGEAEALGPWTTGADGRVWLPVDPESVDARGVTAWPDLGPQIVETAWWAPFALDEARVVRLTGREPFPVQVLDRDTGLGLPYQEIRFSGVLGERAVGWTDVAGRLSFLGRSGLAGRLELGGSSGFVAEPVDVVLGRDPEAVLLASPPPSSLLLDPRDEDGARVSGVECLRLRAGDSLDLQDPPEEHWPVQALGDLLWVDLDGAGAEDLLVLFAPDREPVLVQFGPEAGVSVPLILRSLVWETFRLENAAGTEIRWSFDAPLLRAPEAPPDQHPTLAVTGTTIPASDGTVLLPVPWEGAGLEWEAWRDGTLVHRERRRLFEVEPGSVLADLGGVLSTVQLLFLDPGGLPLAGLEVGVDSLFTDPALLAGRADGARGTLLELGLGQRNHTSQADGTVTLEVPAGEDLLWGAWDGRLACSGRLPAASLTEGAVIPVVLPVGDAVLAGTLAAAGAPLPSAGVLRLTRDAAADEVDARAAAAAVDTDGRFRFEGLGPGTWSLELRIGSLRIPLGSLAPPAEDLVLDAGALRSLRLQVADPGDGGAWIVEFWAAGAPLSHHPLPASPSLFIPALSAGAEWILVRAPGRALWAAPLEAGLEMALPPLEPGRSVRGTLADLGLADPSITALLRADFPPEDPRSWDAVPVDAASGGFRLDHAPLGAFRVQAVDAAGLAIGTPVEIPAAE